MCIASGTLSATGRLVGGGSHGVGQCAVKWGFSHISCSVVSDTDYAAVLCGIFKAFLPNQLPERKINANFLAGCILSVNICYNAGHFQPPPEHRPRRSRHPRRPKRVRGMRTRGEAGEDGKHGAGMSSPEGADLWAAPGFNPEKGMNMRRVPEATHSDYCKSRSSYKRSAHLYIVLISFSIGCPK